MKSTIKAIFSLMLITCALLFITCNNTEGDEEGGMGNFTISFSGLQRTEGSRASVYPPSDSPQGNTDPSAPALSELEIEVIFLRPDFTTERFNFRGDQEIKGTIAAGAYQVGVRVFYLLDRSIYAQNYGADNADIKSGSNDPIRVQLYYKEPVVSMTVITPPSGPSYQGLPVNLAGMVVELSYADGTVSLESNLAKFHADAPGANSSGFSSIVEQGISPQEIIITYVDIGGLACAFAFDVDVVPLVTVSATGSYTASYRNQNSDMRYPDLDGITIEGYYADSIVRIIPLQPDREFNWFETNEYYRLSDGVTPRRLVDPVSMVISYRVASNDADLPTREQSIGDAPRTTSGTEIFAEIHFDNFVTIMEIRALGQPTKTYTASTTPMTIDWIEELTEAKLIFEVHHNSALITGYNLITMDDFKYAYDRKMASIFMFDNFDLASSGRQPAIILQYFYWEDPPIVSPTLVTVPLNVVP